MPFTPFHLGPGLAFEALGGRHFSFMVFGGAQVMMDIEPLLGIVNGWPVLHGWTHTFALALPIGVLAGAIGKPVSEAVLRMAGIAHAPLTWAASFAGGLVGTFSHVLFDAVMHGDMQPLRPFFDDNPFLGLVPMGTLHAGCVALGLAGAAIVAWRGGWPRRGTGR
jgi:hypothetical protein